MRALRLTLTALTALLALLLAGAWFGPEMLDWSRYRGAIATLATSALGRPVHIDGNISLRLLPEPILTAARITVLDRADEGALSVRELRLRVALGPLLAGRVDARELVLNQPELHLAWPLDPDSLPGRPSWLASLAARIENGTLVVGDVTISGIDAAVTTDPDTRALAAAGAAQLFGLPWRFTARLGASGRDGAMTLQATLDGQGPVRDTGGRFSGQIAADGSLQGQISGRGPNLAQILPAPPVPWRAEGRLTASDGLAAADELALEIAGSPARGAVALRVAPMPRLDVALAASRLDLDAWLPVLLHGATGGLETGIDLSAEAATLAGGTLRSLRGAFDLGPTGVAVRDAAAILPGEASLHLSGAMRPAGGAGAPFQGSATLSLPDLRTTLRWLRAAHLPVPNLPPTVLQSGQLTADISLDGQSASLTHLTGSIDASKLSGSAALAFAPSGLALRLQLDRLALDPWLPDPAASLAAGLAPLAGLAAGPDSELHLQASTVTWRGIAAEGVSLDAAVKGGRVTIQLLDGTVQGLRASLSGVITDSGRVADAQATLTGDHADALAGLLAAMLPPRDPPWPLPPALFHGPVRARAQASGAPEALAARIELDLADAQAVAEPVVNIAARSWTATLTLHHPGAPRLLDMFGLPHAEGWLGDGSLSLISQLSAAPGRLAADRFELTAGALRASGALLLQQGDGPPLLSGRITADALPLPPASDPLPFALLRGWGADVRLDAAAILGGGAPLLSQVSSRIMLDAGRLHLEHVTATLSGGAVAGDVVIDGAAAPPRITAQGSIAGLAPGSGLLNLPLDLQGGRLDATAAVHVEGNGVAALVATLSGSARVTATDGRLTGFDMAGATAALGATNDAGAPASGAANPAPPDSGAIISGVRASMTGGASAFTRLEVPLTLAHGIATLGGGSLVGPGGSATLAGSVDLTGPTLDLSATVRPAIPSPPELRVRLTGPVASPVAVADLSDLTRWLAARP